jgi:hypothetical protein
MASFGWPKRNAIPARNGRAASLRSLSQRIYTFFNLCKLSVIISGDFHKT